MCDSPLKKPVVLFNCIISIDNDKNNDEQKTKKTKKWKLYMLEVILTF